MSPVALCGAGSETSQINLGSATRPVTQAYHVLVRLAPGRLRHEFKLAWATRGDPVSKAKRLRATHFPCQPREPQFRLQGMASISNILNNAGGQDELFSGSGTWWVCGKSLAAFGLQASNKERKPAWRMELSMPGSLWRAPSAGSAKVFAVVCFCLRCWVAQMYCHFLNLSQFISVYLNRRTGLAGKAQARLWNIHMPSKTEW